MYPRSFRYNWPTDEHGQIKDKKYDFGGFGTNRNDSTRRQIKKYQEKLNVKSTLLQNVYNNNIDANSQFIISS